MNMDNILNFERRTGVKNEEIEDFERKANEVAAAIEGLRAGTVKPEDIKIDGIESAEEKQQKEAARAERFREMKIRDEKIKQKRKTEEKERWWAGAELFVQNKKAPAVTNEKSATATMKLDYHTLNYSKWNSWEPTDEVSLIEKEEEERRAEEARNKEFEANNKEFCGQFLEDMKKREDSLKKKKESAEKARKDGNKFYAAKKYERALELYFESLSDAPYDVSTLNNIAQVYSKLKADEDAMEFTERVLYIDEQHVKALYRKADVMSKKGGEAVKEALVAITAAAKAVPQDENVQLLLKDIQSMDRELRQEASVAQTLSSDIDAVTSAATVVQDKSSNIANSQKENIDSLKALLTETIAAGHFDANVSRTISSTMATLVPILDKDVLCKTLVRTSDTLSLTCKYLISLVGGSGQNTFDFSESDLVAAVQCCLEFVASAVSGQRSSQQLLLDLKVLPQLKMLLTCCCVPGGVADDAPTGGDVTVVRKIAVADLVFKLLANCCIEDICAKLKLAIVSDRDVLFNIQFMLNRVADSLPAVPGVLSIVNSACSLIKDCANHDGSKTLFTQQTEGIVLAFGTILRQVTAAKCAANSQLWYSSYFPAADALVGGLFYLSRIEVLRNAFANLLTVGTFSGSTAGTLVHVAHNFGELSVNTLSALTNASMGAAETVRAAIATEGGLTLLLENLALSDAQRVKLSTADSSVLVRKAGLLARLATLPDVQSALSESSNFRRVCHRLRIDTPSAEKWQSDERAHYVRVFASMRKLSAQNKTIAEEEGVIASVLEVFPTPRYDLGSITAESVIKVPEKTESPLLLSSATKCLLLLVDDPSFANTLFMQKSLIGTEKLICALSTCTEKNVKKDIASVLSKGCAANAAIKDKIRSLRGIEIIVDLGRRGEI